MRIGNDGLEKEVDFNWVTCFSIKIMASWRIWSSSWLASIFAFTAAADSAVTAAHFSLSIFSSFLPVLLEFSSLLSLLWLSSVKEQIKG